MNEEQAAQPVHGYAVNLALSPKPHPDGKIYQHIVLYYSTEAVNIAMDLGPHQAAQLFLDKIAPALQGIIDSARQADSGLVTAQPAQLDQIKHLDYGRNKLNGKKH